MPCKLTKNLRIPGNYDTSPYSNSNQTTTKNFINSLNLVALAVAKIKLNQNKIILF